MYLMYDPNLPNTLFQVEETMKIGQEPQEDL